MGPSIDILTLFYNGKGLVAPYLESVVEIPVPFELYLLDNGSTDGTQDLIPDELGKRSLRAHFFRSLKNNGFARGINLLAAQSDSDYILILNSDAQIDSGCLQRLVETAESDPAIAICEARQEPREHPKLVDPKTGETSWCSGAAALIRRTAFEEVGCFDEKLFFMYCEDIDLSWKLWLQGWKCVYVRDAIVKHDSPRTMERTLENYFSFRNSLFLYHRYRRENESGLLSGFLWNRFLSRRYSIRSKLLFAIAFADHIRYIPYLMKTRPGWGRQGHPWIRLSETSLAE